MIKIFPVACILLSACFYGWLNSQLGLFQGIIIIVRGWKVGGEDVHVGLGALNYWGYLIWRGAWFESAEPTPLFILCNASFQNVAYGTNQGIFAGSPVIDIDFPQKVVWFSTLLEITNFISDQHWSISDRLFESHFRTGGLCFLNKKFTKFSFTTWMLY